MKKAEVILVLLTRQPSGFPERRKGEREKERDVVVGLLGVVLDEAFTFSGGGGLVLSQAAAKTPLISLFLSAAENKKNAGVV